MTVLRRGLDLALAALVGCVVVVGLTAYLTPALGGRALAIRSGSMAPSIGVGSMVIAVREDPATLVRGDVVAIALPSGTVLTHRIDEIVQQDDRRMFRLKGDANPSPDPALVTQDQLLGKIVAIAPGLGYVLAMMSMPIGVLALLLLGVQMLLGAWLFEELAEGSSRPRTTPRPRTSFDLRSRGARAG
jgi:signal peptidase I